MNLTSIIVPVSDYSLLVRLEKIYRTPWDIMINFNLPLCKKKERLMKWHDERIRYFFEHGREFDFQLDKTLSDIDEAIKLLKAIEETVERKMLDRVKAGTAILPVLLSPY